MKRAVSFLLSLLILLSILPLCAAAAGSYTYTDSANGNSFTVDADWDQKNLTGDPLYKVKFISAKEHGSVISYGSQDVWSQLSLQEQQSIPRSAYDQTMYTPKEIADYLGVKERFVQTVTLSGNTFFRAEEVSSSFIFFQVCTTHLVHIRNGWLYLYSFNGSRYDSCYADFRRVVKSSVFPEVDPVAPSETIPSTTSSETMPGTTAPGETMPPAVTAPTETTPPVTAPTETIPPTTAPTETTPPVTTPVETAPPTTTPVETVPPTVAPEEDIYKRAKAAYEREDYQEANQLFSQIPNYLDSSDYLRLLRIRNYGGNIGIGVVYDFGKALTDAQKQDIDAAAENFNFADTARVLLWNVDVATYFLFDHWYTDNGMYLKWHTDKVGGFYYTRSNKLSTAISNTVSINDGYLRVDIKTTDKLVFHITLTDQDTMELYCYEYDKTYTLTRR